ncbi:MAG: ATP-grasp domain-containing protein [Pseudomonadota bacterium]
MTQTVLLTLGRLPKALELARALNGAGARVIVTDPFARHLCWPSRAVAKSICVPAPATDPAGYRDALLTVIRTENIDLVVPISEEALHTTLLAPHLPNGVWLFGPDHETLRRLHDKLSFNRAAQAAGLHVPETHNAHTSAARTLASDGDYILKPAHGCSGQGFSQHPRGTAIPDDGHYANHVAQDYVDGRHVSVQAIAHGGQLTGCVAYEGLIFAGSVATFFDRVVDEPALEPWVQLFVRYHDYSGFVAFDFIIDARGPMAIECNPRLTSGVHFFDPNDMAACVLDPATPRTVRLKAQRRFQEGHTSLTEAYGDFVRPRTFLRHLKTMAGAKDVLFSAQDPLPFLLMTPMSWDLLKQVIFDGRSFGEAATHDIEWQGAQIDTATTATTQKQPSTEHYA